jgi:uncharacterized membrane protein YccC
VVEEPKTSSDTPYRDTNYGLLLPGEMASLDAEQRRLRAGVRAKLVQHNGHMGERLRWLRAERNLREVSRETKISHGRLQQLEADRLPNPSLSVLLALARVHGCESLDELLGPLPATDWAVRYQAKERKRRA